MEKNKSLKILLVGTGNTGKVINELAPKFNAQITHKINEKNASLLQTQAFDCDVIIDFTSAEAFLNNLPYLLKQNKPLVVGTTGWLNELEKVKKSVQKHNIGFVYASNFSIGVNIFFKLNRLLAEIMKDFPEYDCSVYEIHHKNKKDAPSGTAKTIINDLLKILTHKKFLQLPGDYEKNKPDSEALTVSYSRYGNVKGVHSVIYSSDYDEIKVIHNAYSREGFAAGALKTAHWIKNKKGFFNFNEIWEDIIVG